MSRFVEEVLEFNKIAGNDKYDTKKIGMYVGLILEEVREGLESIPCDTLQPLLTMIKLYETQFKQGLYTDDIANADRVKLLDSAVDTAVVALGMGIALNSDIIGAAEHVSTNNLEKFPIIGGVRQILKDENGKIVKPDGYKSVELEQFLYPVE